MFDGSILSTVMYMWYIQNQTLIVAKITLVKENKAVFKKLIDLKLKSYKTGVYDYTYWDELVDYAKNRDKEWARINLDAFVTTYGIEYLLVFDAKSHLIYSKTSQKNDKNIEASIDLTKLNYENPVFMDYFIMIEGVPAIVFQAPIQPSEDNERLTKPQGYMIGIKLFDKALIKDIGMFLNQDVYFSSTNHKSESDYTYPLTDASNKVIENIRVHLNNTLYESLNALFANIITTILLMTLFSSLIFYWLIKKQILIPLQNLSTMDELTKTYNRRHYNDTSVGILNKAKRAGRLIHFAMIDVDYFKAYNDHYGHQKGDDALISITTCLLNNLNRPDDVIYRVGGEEFVLIFESETKEKAFSFVDNLRKKIEALKIPHEFSQVSQYVTISIGLVSKQAKDIVHINDTYKEADDLLYLAKDAGRNVVMQNSTY